MTDIPSLDDVDIVESDVVDNEDDSCSNPEILARATSFEGRGRSIRDGGDVWGLGVLSPPRESCINERNTGLYCLVMSHCP